MCRRAFCARAWAAVIIVTMAVVDAALRETECPGFQGNRKKLIEAAGANDRLQKVRKCRNALVHLNPDFPALTVDQQWGDRAALETQARERRLNSCLRYFTLGHAYDSPGQQLGAGKAGIALHCLSCAIGSARLTSRLVLCCCAMITLNSGRSAVSLTARFIELRLRYGSSFGNRRL
jgi:hypothetical protein